MKKVVVAAVELVVGRSLQLLQMLSATKAQTRFGGLLRTKVGSWRWWAFQRLVWGKLGGCLAEVVEAVTVWALVAEVIRPLANHSMQKG